MFWGLFEAKYIYCKIFNWKGKVCHLYMCNAISQHFSFCVNEFLPVCSSYYQIKAMRSPPGLNPSSVPNTACSLNGLMEWIKYPSLLLSSIHMQNMSLPEVEEISLLPLVEWELLLHGSSPLILVTRVTTEGWKYEPNPLVPLA